jgi:hypothetical protein
VTRTTPPACKRTHTPPSGLPAHLRSCLPCLLCPHCLPALPCPQIFASRTHSQLSQFVGELHRTPFADEMSLVALGSRKVSGRYSPAVQPGGSAWRYCSSAMAVCGGEGAVPHP